MSIPELDASSPAARPAVAVAIIAIDGIPLDGTVASLSRQAYGVDSIAVIGGDGDQRSAAEEQGMSRFGSVAELAAGIGSEIEMVWILHGDSEPRPDALEALVSEAERNDASLVGSKILDATVRDRLESVGGATDVFGEPYLGLDVDEVDLEQYDVVRDVAHVSGVSLLIRRDLLRGLQGMDPRLPPSAAGMDLSQRARLAGSRVVVVPSSEVFHSKHCDQDVAGWREQAGRMRSMFKAYRLITLAWVIPVGFVVAMLDGIARLFLRQGRPVWDYLRALAWNVGVLPSTIGARRVLSSVRVASDEELFRHQVAGSIRLRDLASELGERLGWVIDREPGVVTEDEVEDDSKAAALVVLVMVVVLVAVGSRRLWFGSPPVGGFSLPLDGDPWQVVRSFAGGWNATGLGSPEPVPPSVAGLSLLQGLMFGWSGARGVAVAASLLAAVVGSGRLLERLGVSGPSRHLSGLILAAGPFVVLQGQAGAWTGLLALGPLVWVTLWALRPVGSKVSWVARLTLVSMLGVVGTYWFPAIALVAIGFGALIVRAPLKRFLAAVPIVVLAGALAASPYLVAVSPTTLFEGGRQIWPTPWLLLVGGGALAIGLFVVPERTWRTVAWGGVLTVAGLTGVAVGSIGLEAQMAALALSSLGLALVVGSLVAQDDDAGGMRKTMQLAVSLGATTIVLAALPLLLDGSLGLADQGWRDRLDFVGSLSTHAGDERVLLIGPAGSLPGEVRSTPSFDFRLANGESFGFDQAFLPEERVGDRALEQSLIGVASGGGLHPGAQLAPFAIRWIVVVGDSAFSRAFDAQLDIREVSLSPGVRIFENRIETSRVDSGTSIWSYGGDRLRGPGVESLRLADNFDPGWTGRADGWANQIGAASGEIVYQPDPLRLGLGAAIAGAIALSLPAAWLGRRRT